MPFNALVLCVILIGMEKGQKIMALLLYLTSLFMVVFGCVYGMMMALLCPTETLVAG